MVLINLLAWRAQQVAYLEVLQKKIIAMAVIATVIALLVLHMVFQQLAMRVERQLTMLTSQVDTALMRDARSVNYVNTDEANSQRIDTAEFIQALTNSVTGNICFSRIARHQQTVQFTGTTRTSQDLASLLADWAVMPHFSQMRINLMKPTNAGTLEIELEGVERGLMDAI